MIQTTLLILFILTPYPAFAGFDIGLAGNSFFWIGLAAWSALSTAYIFKKRKSITYLIGGFMAAFVPQSRRHRSHIVVTQIQPSLHDTVQQKKYHVPLLQDKKIKPTITVSDRVVPAMKRATDTKKKASEFFVMSKKAIAQHAYEAVEIYKKAVRDILRGNQKKKAQNQTQVQKQELQLVQKIVQQQVQKQLATIVAEQKEKEVEVAEEPMKQFPEESIVVPEIQPQLAVVTPTPVQEPVIDYALEDVLRHERMREQALMRAHRAVTRARNAQEGLPKNVTQQKISQGEEQPLRATSRPRDEEDFNESFKSIDDAAHSNRIVHDVEQFQAKVRAAEEKKSTPHITPPLKEPERVSDEVVRTEKEEKSEVMKTKDVITLDASSGTPRLVLTRHNL